MAAKLVSLDKSRMTYPDKDRMVAEFLANKEDILRQVENLKLDIVASYRKERFPYTAFMHNWAPSKLEMTKALNWYKDKLIFNYWYELHNGRKLITITESADADLIEVVVDLLLLRAVFFPGTSPREIYPGIAGALKARIPEHDSSKRIGTTSPMVGLRCRDAIMAADAEYILDRVFGFRDTNHPDDDPLDWGHGGDTDSKVVYLFQRNIMNIMPKR